MSQCIKNLRDIQIRTVEQPIHVLEFLTLLRRKPRPPQADGVHAAHLGRATGRAHVGRRVLNETRGTPHDAVRADAHELMHAGYPPHHRPIFNLDVARQGRQAGHDDVVAENAVVRDVGLRHDEIVRSDFSTAARCRAAVDDGQFTNVALVADGEVARPALIAHVLGGAAQLGAVADAATGADGGT